jgi:hypothetical protein
MDGELQRSVGGYRPGDRTLRRAVHIGMCTHNLLKDLRRQLRCLLTVGVLASTKLNTDEHVVAGSAEKCSALSQRRELHCSFAFTVSRETLEIAKHHCGRGFSSHCFRASRFPKFPRASLRPRRYSNAESKLASPDRATSMPYRRIVRRYWALLREVRDHELESSVSKTSTAYPTPWRLVVCGHCGEFSPRYQNVSDLRMESASFLAFLLDA